MAGSSSSQIDLQALFNAQKDSILAAVNDQIQSLKGDILQSNSELVSQISQAESELYTFKKKGNELQFKFNKQVLKANTSALKSLEGGNFFKAKEELDKGIVLMNDRQKVI